MAVHRYDCIGYEQRIMVMMCKSFPDLCLIQQSKHGKDWFAMGKVWLRSEERDWNASAITFEHNETELVQPISFPTDKIIDHVIRTNVSMQ